MVECKSYWCTLERKHASWFCCDACKAEAEEIERFNMNLCVLPVIVHSVDCGRQKAISKPAPIDVTYLKEAA